MSGLGPPPPPPFPPPAPFAPPKRKMPVGLLVALVATAAVALLIVFIALVLIVYRSVGPDAQTDEEQVKEAITEGFTRWADAEGGDKSACDEIGDYVDWGNDGETAEERCLSEVGSHTEGGLESVTVSQIEVDGKKATATVQLKAEDHGDDQTNEVSLTKGSDDRWRVDGD